MASNYAVSMEAKSNIITKRAAQRQGVGQGPCTCGTISIHKDIQEVCGTSRLVTALALTYRWGSIAGVRLLGFDCWGSIALLTSYVIFEYQFAVHYRF